MREGRGKEISTELKIYLYSEFWEKEREAGGLRIEKGGWTEDRDGVQKVRGRKVTRVGAGKYK